MEGNHEDITGFDDDTPCVGLLPVIELIGKFDLDASAWLGLKHCYLVSRGPLSGCDTGR